MVKAAYTKKRKDAERRGDDAAAARVGFFSFLCPDVYNLCMVMYKI